MRDLISRAAAIDAIVGTTAFPDVEYIRKVCENPLEREDWLGGVLDAIDAVEDVNAVDAIPMEWLEWRIEHAKREGFDEIEHMLRTVRDWWNNQRELWMNRGPDDGKAQD